MSTATSEPMFDLAPAVPDPLAARVRAIVPAVSSVQVAELAELVAAQAEAIARPAKRGNTLGPTP